jgi:xanthine dehydrogenase YagR molybdenum-binding subunit
MLSWPEKRDVIGQATLRVDAPAKVTGAARYSSDVQPDGWLYGMIYRSRWPAARVASVNIEKAKQIPGIKAVVVERDGERTVRFYVARHRG